MRDQEEKKAEDFGRFKGSGQYGVPRPGGQIFKSNENPEVYISNWNNFLLSAASGAIDFATGSFVRSFNNLANQADVTSHVLDSDEIKSLQEDRPGLEFPLGVRESTAKYITENYDAKRFRQQILDRRQPGFIPAALQFTGTMLGAAVSDPIGIYAATSVGSAVRATVGLGRGPTLASRSELLKKRAIVGAAEGAAFGAVESGAQQIERITSGDSFDAFDMALTIGEFMSVGAVLHPIGGFIRDTFSKERRLLSNRAPVGQEASDNASQTAANMMMAGKDPNPSIAIREGYLKQAAKLHEDMKREGVTPEKMIEALDDARFNIERAQQVNQEKIASITNELKQPEVSTARKKELEDLLEFESKNAIDLDQRMKSQEVLRDMVDTTEAKLSDEAISDFVKKMDDTSSDFANGNYRQTIQEPVDQIRDARTLLNDTFDPDARQSLERIPRNADEQLQFEQIRSKQERLDKLNKAIEDTILCMV